MYLVTGATGKTGRSVVRHLIENGEKVTAYVRSREKAKSLIESGVNVIIGDLEDTAKLTEAMTGVKGVYLMLPYNFSSSQFVEDGRETLKHYKEAIVKSGVKRVIIVSSIGAHLSEETGPILRERQAEIILGDLSNVKFIRPAYFMENWINVIGVVHQIGILPSFLTLDKPISMVSVKDIGRKVAEMLTVSDCPRILELASGQDISPTQLAEAMGHQIEKPVSAVLEKIEDVINVFMGIGFSKHISELSLEMYESYNSDLLKFESEPERTDTPLEEILTTLLLKQDSAAYGETQPSKKYGLFEEDRKKENNSEKPESETLDFFLKK